MDVDGRYYGVSYLAPTFGGTTQPFVDEVSHERTQCVEELRALEEIQEEYNGILCPLLYSEIGAS